MDLPNKLMWRQLSYKDLVDLLDEIEAENLSANGAVQLITYHIFKPEPHSVKFLVSPEKKLLQPTRGPNESFGMLKWNGTVRIKPKESFG